MKGFDWIRRFVYAVNRGTAAIVDHDAITADGCSITNERVTTEECQSLSERVLTVLYTAGGEVSQQDVITETGYRVEKVSELLREMEADGKITWYWKDGRKVVTYPELHPEPTEIDS